MVINRQYTCIIPARYKSSRFEGKPLARICGKTMISIVYLNATAASLVKKAIVATDDKRIYDHCKEAGINVVYTSESCKNGSERVAEVAQKSIKTPYVFEMQGDQPLVTPDVIDDFLKRASLCVKKNPDVDVIIPFTTCSDICTASPDILKVVVTSSNRLVFQTRQPIQTGYRTLGLYLWGREALIKFSKLPVSPIEKAEDSHPIRLYVNDFFVQGLTVKSDEWIEVDRKHQIGQVETIMQRKANALRS